MNVACELIVKTVKVEFVNAVFTWRLKYIIAYIILPMCSSADFWTSQKNKTAQQIFMKLYCTVMISLEVSTQGEQLNISWFLKDVVRQCQWCRSLLIICLMTSHLYYITSVTWIQQRRRKPTIVPSMFCSHVKFDSKYLNQLIVNLIENCNCNQ